MIRTSIYLLVDLDANKVVDQFTTSGDIVNDRTFRPADEARANWPDQKPWQRIFVMLGNEPAYNGRVN